jgi:HD-like signal output (HDOD) protein
LLAERRGERNVERLFVAGMLHDVGRLVLYVQAPDLAGTVLSRARSAGILLYQAEREVLGFDHGEVGGALMTRWQMPSTLVETVARHHSPDAETSNVVDVATIHVADIVANQGRLGSSGETLVPPASPRALAALAIAEDALPELGAAVEAEYARSVAAFGLD